MLVVVKSRIRISSFSSPCLLPARSVYANVLVTLLAALPLPRRANWHRPLRAVLRPLHVLLRRSVLFASLPKRLRKRTCSSTCRSASSSSRHLAQSASSCASCSTTKACQRVCSAASALRCSSGTSQALFCTCCHARCCSSGCTQTTLHAIRRFISLFFRFFEPHALHVHCSIKLLLCS